MTPDDKVCNEKIPTKEAVERLKRVEEVRLKLHKIMENNNIDIYDSTSSLSSELMEITGDLWLIANQRLSNESEWPRKNWPK